jgi:hypothetical protein
VTFSACSIKTGYYKGENMATQWTAQGITSGAVLPAATLQSIGAAWETWTPVITATAGSITSYTTTTPRYARINKIVVGQIIFAITNVGTASGVPIFTLPITAASTISNVIFGSYRETAATGLTGVVGSFTTTQGLLYRYDNANHIATGRTYSCSFTYEAA